MRSRIAPLPDVQRAFLVRYEMLYAEWLAAEEAAREAEAALLAAIAAHREGRAAAVPRDQWTTALRLRALAERALDRALEFVRSTPL